MDKPTQRSVAIVIRRGDPAAGELLVVKRPRDDPDLPGIWGLPSATLASGETWLAGVKRTGRQKLGVELRAKGLIREGSTERGGYALRMRVYAAEAMGGEPEVPQPHGEVTQYTAWSWGTVGDLVRGARMGSLCCRLMLESVDASWREPGH